MSEATHDYSPTTSEEEQAAAYAIYQARKQQVAIDLAEDLTDRERVLTEEAYAQGAADAQAKVLKTIGQAAETLRASEVRQAATGGCCIETRKFPPGDWYDDKLLKITKRVANILSTQGGG